MERNQRKTLVGRVVSDKMDKTITVVVETKRNHPVYGKPVSYTHLDVYKRQHLELPPFTLVGATTRAGMLSNPLRARFGINGCLLYTSRCV